jgi:hypothetical protein
MALGKRAFKEMGKKYTKFTDANRTLRNADLFPSLVYGIGVFVRHLDIQACQRRDGHKPDHPHIP